MTITPPEDHKTCPYCLGPAVFKPSSSFIFRKDYGPLWYCRSCNAWVGCHKGTDKPLGRLANAELRQWKIKAHNKFDQLWRPEGANMTRSEAYKYLAGLLGIPPHTCHIGWMDIDYCKRVVELLP